MGANYAGPCPPPPLPFPLQVTVLLPEGHTYVRPLGAGQHHSATAAADASHTLQVGGSGAAAAIVALPPYHVA